MTNKNVQKVVLTIQTVKTRDGVDIDGIFGTIVLNPKGKKTEGERISFRTYLGEVKEVEKYVNDCVKEALRLDKAMKAKAKESK